jgi:hypothetical protein
MLHALPVRAADGVFTLSDRTEARARAPDPITNQAVALDVETVMDARAVWVGHTLTYTLADLPRFTLLDFNGAAIQPAFLDSLLAAVEWRSPRVRIRVAEAASYGQLSIESLSALPSPGTPAPAANPTGQPAPLPSATLGPATSAPLLYASSETSAATTLLLKPWTVLTRIGYRLAGGGDSSAQRSLPFQQGPFAEANADYRVTGHDHLSTVGSASETSFAGVAGSVAEGTNNTTATATLPATEDVLLSAEEQWRHRWARMTETLLSGGWYASSSQVGNTPTQLGNGPVAEAAFGQRFERGGDSTSVRADVRVAPLVDTLNGTVDEQIRASLEASWTHRRFNLRGYVSAGGSVQQGTPISDRVAAAELDAAYRVSEKLTFDTGVRALYQEQNALGPVPAGGGNAPIVEGTLSQVVIFLAVTVRPVKARF